MESEIAKTRLELALLALVTLVVGGFVSALVARHIARPVRQLAEGVAAVARGELDRRYDRSTADEIGGLAVAFNQMADELLAQRTALLRQSAELVASNSELRQRFVELSDLKSYTDSILGSLTSGVITLDLEGRVVTVNAEAQALLGCSLQQVQGSVCAAMFPNNPEVVELLRQTLTTVGQRVLSLVTVTRSDGHAVPVEVAAAPLRGAQGNNVGVLAVFRDLSAVRQLEEQLRQAQKMEAIGRLAGGVAHDFNNLLTVITGRNQLLLGRLEPGDPRRRDVELAEETVVRAASLTRQLLTFSRREVVQPRVINLNAEVVAIKRMLRHLIGEDVILVTVLAPALGCVKADPGHLEQVLMNLAVNARDAMPKGGRLTIETKDVELDESFARSHVGVQPGSYVLLAVSDTGVGMDAETRTHLFEPFFTTKPPGKGSGLGLATVYGIVKQTGGHIWVESEPGQGATFRIYLPRVDAVAEVRPQAPVEAEAAGGSETVLLVEDEEAVRLLAVEVLRMQGYNVLEARHPGEALLIGERHPGPIHLLLTDMVMPQMGGRELANRLVLARPGMKVIYTSGYTAGATLQEDVLERSVAFLGKPFTPKILARKVREVLDAVPLQVT